MFVIYCISVCLNVIRYRHIPVYVCQPNLILCTVTVHFLFPIHIVQVRPEILPYHVTGLELLGHMTATVTYTHRGRYVGERKTPTHLTLHERESEL